jgi:hypothetical protein
VKDVKERTFPAEEHTFKAEAELASALYDSKTDA